MAHKAMAVRPHTPPIIQEGRLVSALRWTLWLSVLTAPCGYLTSILLARVGPQAIGEYGLLSLYVAITSVFLFLGGPAVAIRFIPVIEPGQIGQFFWSYLIVACFAALPFQITAVIWPGSLRYVFGEVGGAEFHLLLMGLANVYILFHLTISGLKAILEIKLAQMLLRSVTVASSLVYATVYLCTPRFLAGHFHAVIWCTYIGITVVVTIIALDRFLALIPRRRSRRLFVLPAGFWRYTLSLQVSSILGFLSTKLDYLLVLNAGGVPTLGHYVALMTLVSIVPMFATFVLDSYLPSLTTLLSSDDLAGSERVTRTYIRLICLAGAGVISCMSLFAEPVVQVLGSRYADLTNVLRIALPFAGVQIGNWIIGTIFSAVGLPQRDAVSKALRALLFLAAFPPFWKSAHLLGAVWVWGIAEVAYQLLSLWLLSRTLRFRLHLFGAYAPMLALSMVVTCVGGLIAAYGPLAALAAWFMTISGFLVAARYSADELITLLRTIMPGGRATDAEVFGAKPGASTAA